MKLAGLSVEVMRFITEMAGATAVLALWVSGDSGLRHLLGARGGVVVMNLLDRSVASTSRWPLLLADLKGLRELKIDRGSRRLQCVELVCNELKKMKELHVLHITSADAPDILFRARKTGGKEKLADLLPNLQDLLISDLSIVLPPNKLPDSLIDLRIHGFSPNATGLVGHEGMRIHLVCQQLRLPQLPSNLVSLEVSHIPAPLWNALPNSLTKLSTTILPNLELYDEGFSLPRTLVHLELSTRGAFIGTFRHLTRLQTLKLWAHVVGRPTEMNERHIAPFPMSLTELYNTWILPTAYPLVLPPRLRSLDLTGSASIISFRTLRVDVENALEIPQTASQWRQMTLPSLDTFSREGLPLEMTKFGYTHWGDASKFNALPWLPCSHLTVLATPNLVFDDKMAQLFPVCPNLESIHAIITTSVLPPLIAQAKYLRTAYLQSMCIPTPSMWQDLPRDLEYLDISLYGLQQTDVPWTQPFLHLPHRQLKTVRFLNTQSSPITLSDLNDLSNLKVLQHLSTDLTFDKSVLNEHIALLPRSLKDIWAGFGNLTGKCFKYLPPNLLSISPSSIQLKDHHMALLPKTLQSITLSHGKSPLTLACLPYLPPRLNVPQLFPDTFTLEDDSDLLEMHPDPRLLAGNPTPLYNAPLPTSSKCPLS